MPLNYKTPAIIAGTQTLEGQRDDWPNNYSFFSRHPSGGQFGMCDASVRFVSNTIDINVYRSTATLNGGEVVSLD